MEHEFSTQRLANLIGVKSDRIRQWHRKGIICGIREGRALRFSFQDLVAGRAAQRLLDRGLSLGLVIEAVSKLRHTTDGDPLVRLRLDEMNGRLILNEGNHLIDVRSGQLHLDVFNSESAPTDKKILPLPSASRVANIERPQVDLRQLIQQARQAELVDDWPLAAQAYRGILVQQPEDVSAVVNLGNCHYQLGEYTTAIEVYRAAIQLRADCAEAWYNLGNVLDTTEQFDDAVAAFQTALALDEDHFEVHFNLALTLEKMGRRQKAKQHWLKVLSLTSDPEATATAVLFIEAEDEKEC